MSCVFMKIINAMYYVRTGNMEPQEFPVDLRQGDVLSPFLWMMLHRKANRTKFIYDTET